MLLTAVSAVQLHHLVHRWKNSLALLHSWWRHLGHIIADVVLVRDHQLHYLPLLLFARYLGLHLGLSSCSAVSAGLLQVTLHLLAHGYPLALRESPEFHQILHLLRLAGL